MSKQRNLFDGPESQRRKEHGMSVAADEMADTLEKARDVARELCRWHGQTNADAVGEVMLSRYGVESLGPAAGSIFKSKEFEFTGQFVPSTRKTNHGRLLRVWRLKT